MLSSLDNWISSYSNIVIFIGNDTIAGIIILNKITWDWQYFCLENTVQGIIPTKKKKIV